mgnify:CR=1 FL=1
MKSAIPLFVVIFIIMLPVGCGERTSGIQGKVIEGKGQPMSGIKIIAKQVRPIEGYEQFETTTGADGAF